MPRRHCDGASMVGSRYCFLVHHACTSLPDQAAFGFELSDFLSPRCRAVAVDQVSRPPWPVLRSTTAEGGRATHQEATLSYAAWPKFDPVLLVEDTLEIPVQVNGMRGQDRWTSACRIKHDPQDASLRGIPAATRRTWAGFQSSQAVLDTTSCRPHCAGNLLIRGRPRRVTQRGILLCRQPAGYYLIGKECQRR